MKPICIFTSFWDAEYLIKQGKVKISDTTIDLLLDSGDEPCNYSVQSIALIYPDLHTLPNIKKYFDTAELNLLGRVDIFCPTYLMLKEYKADKDWAAYTEEYKYLLIQRKSAIIKWIEELKNNMVYILCCWENTSKGVHCHRQLLYSAFTQSAKLKDKAIYVYRHGNEKEM